MGYVVGSRGVGVYPAPPCYGVSGMYIEEAYKHSTWCGLQGIEMVVSAKVHEVGRERSVSVTIHITGTITPIVALHIDTLSYPRYSRDEWIAAIHGWVDRQGYREQWMEELARYNHVVSQVDLGVPGQVDEGKSVSAKGLNYRLSLGYLYEAYIDVYVWVGYYPHPTTLSTIIYIELVEEDTDDGGRQEHNRILIENDVYGDDILPITTESLMPIVRRAVEQFTKRVQGLLDEPLVPLQPIEGEGL